MLTTAFGLIVAIPTLLSHAVLIARQDTLLDRFESASVKLFNDPSSFQLAPPPLHFESLIEKAPPPNTPLGVPHGTSKNTKRS